MRILVVTQHFWPENFRINDIVEGFVQDGLRKGYYDLPKEDAVLMSRTDESVPKR